MNITIETNEKTVIVKSPYHPKFPRHAKNLGGKWNASEKTWQFDIRDEASVRDLCKDCFGTDGTEEPELVDCRIVLNGSHAQSIWFAGREIARRPARDCPVKLGHNVVVCNGGEFHSSGGSRKYPRITFSGEIILEVRDIPLSLAQREQDADPNNVTILNESPQTTEPTILSELCKILETSEEDAVAEALEHYLNYLLLHPDPVE